MWHVRQFGVLIRYTSLFYFIMDSTILFSAYDYNLRIDQAGCVFVDAFDFEDDVS